MFINKVRFVKPGGTQEFMQGTRNVFGLNEEVASID